MSAPEGVAGSIPARLINNLYTDGAVYQRFLEPRGRRGERLDACADVG
jgi:hypothetical protein